MKLLIIISMLAIAIITSVIVFTSNGCTSIFEKSMQEMKKAETFEIRIKTPIEHKVLKQNGYSINYFASGKHSKELIIFLHPAFADHRCFDKQIDNFSNNYRVVTIDLLGHGLSKVDKAKDKIDYSIHHINEIIQLEGYETAHFVGVSMGSLITQYYALTYPKKVSSMTILGGYDINANNKKIKKAQRSENIKWIFKAIISMNSFREYVSSVSVSKIDEQVLFYKMTKLFTRKSFTVMSGLGKVIKQRENIKKEYPILIINGDKDIELAKKAGKEWHVSEPNSKYSIINDAGHCANMDNSDDFNKIVMTFIENVK